MRAVRTNTPLHALTLLNDVTYVEAARVLAEEVLREKKKLDARLDAMAWRVLSRPLQPAERQLLRKQVEDALKFYAAQPALAKEAVSHGQREADAQLPPEQTAAYALAAGALMNLDEAITRE